MRRTWRRRGEAFDEGAGDGASDPGGEPPGGVGANPSEVQRHLFQNMGRGRWNVPQSTELSTTEPEDELMPPSVETQPSCRAVNAECPEAFAPDEETSGELP